MNAVAWLTRDTVDGLWYPSSTKKSENDRPLYTSPPKRQPLTDEQIEEIADGYLVDYRIPAGCAWNFARDIEAAHGIGDKT